MVADYEGQLHQLLVEGKACQELRPDLDAEAAATLFIGMIQGLVMQSLIAGDIRRMTRNAPRIFAIYRQGIEACGTKLEV
ncbi:TetR family transcriptional regulator C-terminal domain-containing protein [Pseudorhodobacter sp.]|uniref:TetR family transcriptional regulator C-terminal domain-containing protein n=1 Tax=Pseudorhodobacter sp. TaxID=1934400 RepID=UPI0026497CB5|nr:TetR family transcriptional regulator C-terminal domain-containing protein [Pseudorhodobacter sp.]MDN5787650.1 TetR family transcriptional regulator C-terminal domain-containing protein [Pseudorhodobacter sp.]